jgi:spermidine synthase
MSGRGIEAGESTVAPLFGVAREPVLLAWFAATMLLGAFLLFAIQPLFARLALPLLGGAPVVWNTAMVFFQGALLAGYGYAHLLGCVLGLRGQIAIHLGLLALAALWLPVMLDAGWTPPSGAAAIPWLLVLMAWMLGLPFVAVAATAPLLQRWFAATGHAAAADPYFLYASSNLGSVGALLAYPLLIEPTLTLHVQSLAWTCGYGALALAITGCALILWRSRSPGMIAARVAASEEGAALDWRIRLRWLALALVASALLLAVTAHATTDLAAVPLLWVVPLALYLLTYVIAFARRPLLRHSWTIRAQPFVLIPLVLIFTRNLPFWVGLPLHFLALFVTALVCHGELARLRPPVSHLTEFYFWLAAGGVLGGAFTALLAPLLFDRVLEYPLALVAACLLRPAVAAGPRRKASDLALALAVGALIALRGGALGLDLAVATRIVVLTLLSALLLYALAARPLGFALGIAAALGATLLTPGSDAVLARERSFFGVYTVKRDPTGFHVLVHGTTVHGAESIEAPEWREPLTYYHRAGPLGQLFTTYGRRLRSVGVVGLGLGTVACYRQPGRHWTFYEIDPLVERIARDERHFHYLAACGAGADVRTGDARLTLRAAPSGHYDLLILDAFSSDAIPIHLITREALTLYLDKLAPGGVIAWHVSNRNLDLGPIIGDLAADAGLAAWVRIDQPPPPALAAYRSASEWIALARHADDLGALVADTRWRRLDARAGARPWTDDFAPIVDALRWSR